VANGRKPRGRGHAGCQRQRLAARLQPAGHLEQAACHRRRAGVVHRGGIALQFAQQAPAPVPDRPQRLPREQRLQQRLEAKPQRIGAAQVCQFMRQQGAQAGLVEARGGQRQADFGPPPPHRHRG
jgi:hypothetical protein